MPEVEQRRWALITGASRGIGRAIALRLAQGGFNLVLSGRTATAALSEVVEEVRTLGAQARSLSFDISDRAACAQTLSSDIEAHGAYYGVVCNAGITRDGTFAAMPELDWDEVLHTNLDGFYNVVRPVLMPMIRMRCGGRIVAMSSVSGIAGNRGQVNYSAAKAGIIGASKALAVELASRKITVNCVAPGLIRTEMVEGAVLEKILKAIPVGRAGEAHEVASLVGYLFSDSAAYITRQVIGVNGGLI
jgi:3-oxoacyl-[acyl-carrier protein] reductase